MSRISVSRSPAAKPFNPVRPFDLGRPSAEKSATSPVAAKPVRTAAVAPSTRARIVGALALVAAGWLLLAVTDLMIERWADDGRLLAWVVGWALAFVALAVFADPLQALLARGGRAWRAAAARRDAARKDAELWRLAQTDTRLMADLQAIVAYHGDRFDSDGAVTPAQPGGIVAPVGSNFAASTSLSGATWSVQTQASWIDPMQSMRFAPGFAIHG
ncbi:MAG: hypothetical protein ABIW85_06925 [Variovorax sp.]